jgi:Luciferase-like monooxygenase
MSADYGHEIEFGYFLIPEAGNPKGVLETARLADRLGYDLLAVQDHPYQPAHLDTLALLGVILAQTERIRVLQDVGNLPLRPPAVFAKAAATACGTSTSTYWNTSTTRSVTPVRRCAASSGLKANDQDRARLDLLCRGATARCSRVRD